MYPPWKNKCKRTWRMIWKVRFAKRLYNLPVASREGSNGKEHESYHAIGDYWQVIHGGFVCSVLSDLTILASRQLTGR